MAEDIVQREPDEMLDLLALCPPAEAVEHRFGRIASMGGMSAAGES
jgi:hypothetical protein